MRKGIYLLLALICTSCSGIAIPLDKSDYISPDKISFEFVDLRQENEKLIRNAKEEQPYLSYGDKEFVPDRLLVLKDALMNQCGQKLSGHKVVITRFEFVAYIPGFFKKLENVGNASAFGGLVGGSVAAAMEKPDMGDRFICSLEATIDGKPIAVNDYEAIPGYIDLSPAKEAGNKLIQRTITAFVAKVNISL